MYNYYNLLKYKQINLSLNEAVNYLNNLLIPPTHSNIYNFDATNYELIFYIEFLYGETPECKELLQKVKNFIANNYILRKKIEIKY